MYGNVPPEAVKSIEPVLEPLQRTFTWVSVRTIADGCVIVTDSDFVQALASITVTV